MTPTTVFPRRLILLVLALVLFVIAGLEAGGTLTGGPNAHALAYFGFAALTAGLL